MVSKVEILNPVVALGHFNGMIFLKSGIW